MQKLRKKLNIGNLFGGEISIPVYEIDSEAAGPIICLIGMNHGFEYIGAKIINKIFNELNLKKGKIIAMPVANVLAAMNKSYSTPVGFNSPSDTMNLNRVYPGNEEGDYLTSKIAFKIFETVKDCDYLFDLHSAGIYGDILTNARVRNDSGISDEIKSKSLEVAKASGIKHIISSGSKEISPHAQLGILTTQASTAGIPSVTFEINGSIGKEDINAGYEALLNIFSHLDMIEKKENIESGKIYTKLKKLYIPANGFLEYFKKLGEECKQDEVIAKIIDPFSEDITKIKAPFDGFLESTFLYYVVNEGDYLGEFVGV